MLRKISFLITFILTSFAIISVIPVSYNTFTATKPCPSIGIIPACYIVTLGYSLILLSLFRRGKKVFYIGWTPVFLLAIGGSTMEFLKGDVCPKNDVGIPLCYYSLLLSCLVLVFYNIFKSFSNKK